MTGRTSKTKRASHSGRRDKVESSKVKLDFNVVSVETIELKGPPALMKRDLMSPFVWQDPNGRFGIMVRAVCKPSAKMVDTGIIWGGWSDDGCKFQMLDEPSIAPGPEEYDIGGVEDPTVFILEDGSYVVYYSSIQGDKATGELSYAVGPSIDKLEKKGVALASSKTAGNTKEATVYRAPNGKWWLLYEYATHEASLIGLAVGDDFAGPWREEPTPFNPRDDSWDNWHLSTGPLFVHEKKVAVMFYNGATRDARWRIGWIALEPNSRAVLGRGIQPLVTPPPGDDREATDIAFAASAFIEDDHIWLYYSLQDARLERAKLRWS